MADTASDTHADAHEAHHPTEREYVRIAIILAILTAIEVAMFYIEMGALFMPSLIVLMIIKFVMVVGYFMHLKWDTHVYRRFIYIGLTLAVFVYGVALATFLNITPAA